MKHPIRFLLVEDEALIAMWLEWELKQAGYTVCERVPSGEEAIVSVERDHPDVVMIDIGLAGNLDGIETARKIQAIAAIPIIFMTGYVDKDVLARANQLKPLGIFIKPIEMEKLKTIVDAAFADS